jgi:thymidylate synthase (FAD)
MTQIEATYIDHMGSDLSVVNAARVSFGKKSAWNWSKELESGTGNGNTLKAGDTKLIKYLASHGHISPFGHCFASFHVKAPIYVARQLVKHSYLRWNEVSRRYVDDEPEFYQPDVWRGRSADKKQGSSDEEIKGIHTDATLAYVKSLYNHMLSEGVAPEQARMVLPQSTMTEWYWSGSLDAFADMCRLRCASDTQAETQEVAWQIYHKMEDLFPVSWVALMEDAY